MSRTDGSAGSSRSGWSRRSAMGTSWVPLCYSATNTLRADRHIVVPEGVGALAVTFPAEAEIGELGTPGAVEPLAVDVVGRYAVLGQPGDRRAVEPGLDGAVGARDLELDAVPC